MGLSSSCYSDWHFPSLKTTALGLPRTQFVADVHQQETSTRSVGSFTSMTKHNSEQTFPPTAGPQHALHGVTSHTSTRHSGSCVWKSRTTLGVFVLASLLLQYFTFLVLNTSCPRESEGLVLLCQTCKLQEHKAADCRSCSTLLTSAWLELPEDCEEMSGFR